MKVKLGLEALGMLDNGKVRAAVNKELNHVLEDCADRPGDASARTVTIQIKVTPEQDETGVATTGQMEVEVKSTVPPRRTRPYQFEIVEKAGGTEALFNDVSRTNVRQGTLDEVSEGNSEAVAAAAGEKVKKAKGE